MGYYLDFKEKIRRIGGCKGRSHEYILQDMTVEILSDSSAAYQEGFHGYNWRTETWQKLCLSGFR